MLRRAAPLFIFLAAAGHVIPSAAQPAVLEFVCSDPKFTKWLEGLRTSGIISKVELSIGGALKITITDGQIIYIQPGAGCGVLLPPGS